MALTRKKLSAIKNEAEFKLIPPEQFTNIKPITVNALTATHFKWITKEQVENLSETVIYSFSREQIQHLGNKIAWFTSVQMGYLNHKIAWLTDEQLQKLNLEHLKLEQIIELGERIKYFKSLQLANFTKVQIHKFNKKIINFLSPEQLLANDAWLLVNFLPEQFALLNTKQIKALMAVTINVLTPAQCLQFNKQKVKVLIDSYLQANFKDWTYYNLPTKVQLLMTNILEKQLPYISQKEVFELIMLHKNVITLKQDVIINNIQAKIAAIQTIDERIKAETGHSSSLISIDNEQFVTIDDYIKRLVNNKIDQSVLFSSTEAIKDSIFLDSKGLYSLIHYLDSKYNIDSINIINLFIDEYIGKKMELEKCLLISKLDEKRVLNLDKDDIKYFSKNNIKMISYQQIEWLDKKQFAFFSPEHVSFFNVNEKEKFLARQNDLVRQASVEEENLWFDDIEQAVLEVESNNPIIASTSSANKNFM